MTSPNQLRSFKKSCLLMMVTTATTCCSAFTLPAASSPSTLRVKNNNHQSMRIRTDLNSYAIDSEDDALMMMMRANTCAHSDTCSIDEAGEYLNEMLHLQSDCASGSLSSGAICEDVSFPTEVIAGLREKIQAAELSNQVGAFSVGLNPVFLALFALYVSSGMFSLAHSNPDTFTMQEWMYAIQGGYLDDMVSQYIKYGGLSPLTSSSLDTSVVLTMSLQEWMWSIRDGYVGNMFTEYQNHGGLLSFIEEGTDPDDLILTTPLTTEEWSFAVKGGYLTDMIGHYMRNGGL